MTAADQPTTEPHETRDAIAKVLNSHHWGGTVGRSHDDPGGIRWSCTCGHESSIEGMSGHSSWLAAHAVHAADELLAVLAPAPQPATDLRDLATWTPAEVAASPVGASRLIQHLAATAQPAADTEATGTRWYAPAYRAQNGNVISAGYPTVIREHAQQQVDEEDQADWPGGLFVATTIKYPWEEA